MPGAAGMSWAVVIFAFVIRVAGTNNWVKTESTYVAPAFLVKH